jgi:putative ABC transport system permease protein
MRFLACTTAMLLAGVGLAGQARAEMRIGDCASTEYTAAIGAAPSVASTPGAKGPSQLTFFDEVFDRAYRVERRLGTMFSAFAGLAVFIACLGLLGLASFTAEQKTKEIGIRKVLGASSSGIVVLLSREFMKWVVAANLVAWPIGYLAMRTWLQNFAYRIDLTVPMFLGAALAAFFIAMATISFQTYRAATANPARSMRYE